MVSNGSRAASIGCFRSSPPSLDGGWWVVVPYKGGPHGKSRLQSQYGSQQLGPALRRDLALGFLQDTVAAAAAAANVAHIIVVSSDPTVDVLNDPKVEVLPDPGQGLNGAVKTGFAFSRSSGQVPVAAIAADLPCLTVGDLEETLVVARRHPLAVVSDRQGTGSTLISARPGVEVLPRFGHRSYEAHLQAGHRPLAIPGGSTLRFDVDTIEDLAIAIRRGVGAYTRGVLLSSGLVPSGGVSGNNSVPSHPTMNLTLERKPCPVS
ncbi:2-phospho-L-lactate guanylyltransferase [Pseudarthrobacter phenanthrenivorans]|uniref:2-phospho-L-lactate guanylyltransferase n=1 Tax=Pseudarthrobacter phenanthrenivorans TaxID=361575 RepID=UPI00344CF39E